MFKNITLKLLSLSVALSCVQANAGVTNGTPVNAATTNAAFMDKNTTTTFTTAIANIIGGIETKSAIDAASTGANQSVTLTAPITIYTNVSLSSINNITLANRQNASLITVRNNTGGVLTLVNNSGGTASLRILTGTGANLALPDASAASMYYDTVNAKWQVVSMAGADVSASNIAAGTLALARGGTGQVTKAAAFDALAPCTSGGGGLIQYGSGTNSCLTTAIGDLGKPLVSSGALSGNTWATLTVLGGGSGLATRTAHALQVGNGTTAVTQVGPSSSTAFPLVSAGSSADPAYSLLTVAGGGSGLATLTAHSIQVGAGTSNITQLGTGTTGQALLSAGSGSDPAWSTPTYPSASGSAGKVLRADGTNNLYSTFTIPDTFATGDIPVATGTNVLGVVAGGTSGYVLTANGAGVAPTYQAATGGSGGVNFITNPGAEIDTSGWAAYALTEAVTFTDAGDLVTLSAHGLSTGTAISFSVITTTTGISINTTYYVIYASTSTFQVASSLANAQAGTALALTTNGSGTVLKSIPMTGTGGSPTVTWTRSTSSPLTNTASFLFTKDAANRMGEGASADFTIDSASQAKVLSIDFDYVVASGTFVAGSSGVNSDIQLAVYDITNAVMIQPSTFKLFASTTAPPSHFSSTFQTASNSTSYRLIFYVSTNSASAYTVKFDTVTVAPSKYIYGTPITDWQSWTPTGLMTTNTGYAGLWRRVGDSMEAIVRLSFTGAPNSVNADVSLPSGYSIDTAKLVNTSVGLSPFGIANGHDSGNAHVGVIVYSTTTAVRAFGDDASGSWTQAVPFTVGNGDFFEYHFTVPILGWSSSVQMSDNADTRVVAGAINLGGGVALATSGTDTLVPSMNITHDTHGMCNTTTRLCTIGVSGYYKISFGMWYTNNATGRRSVSVAKNSSIILQGAQVLGQSGFETGVTGSGTLLLAAGDTLGLWYRQDSGGSLNTAGSSATNFMSFEKVSGPSAIAATEFIGARYTNTAGTSIANTGTPAAVPFATKDYDTHGIFVTDTATITAAGKYKISCTINWASSTWALSNAHGVIIYKNGAVKKQGPTGIMGGASVGGVGDSVDAQLDLVAGDAIKCDAYNTRTAGATTLNTTADYNSFEIQRVGL